MEDHDQRFKQMIQMFLAELFEAFFPRWYGRFDFPSAAWLDQEVFLDPPQGERRVIDLVARLPLKPQPDETVAPQELALIHIEVEAEETTVPLRRRFYDSYQALRRKHGLPVLPIAVFLRVGLDGTGKLSYEETFDDLMVLTFTFEYVGLPALDAEEHLNGLNMLAVAMSTLMTAPRHLREVLAAEAIKRIEESNLDIAKKYLLGECIKTYSPLTKEQWEAFDKLIRTAPYRGVLNMTKTWTEEGEERGVLKGERGALLRLLDRRYGPLSVTVKQRVEALTLESVRQMTDAIFSAQSLRELGLEESVNSTAQ